MNDLFEQYSEDFEAPDQAVVDEMREDQLADAEELVEAQERQEAVEEAAVEEETVEEPEQQRTRSQAKKEQEEKAAEPEDVEEDPRGYSGMDGLGRAVDAVKGVAEKVKKTAQPLLELSQSPAAGTADYIADTLNMIPNVNVPKYRKFESEYAEASREIASFVVPNLFLAKGGKALGAGLQGKVGWKIGQGKLAKLIGEAGMDIGTGVLVDYTNTSTAEGDNLQGTLKKMFPKTFSWISKDWATIDGDDPDLKRAKSINEGVGLGMFTSLLEASGKLLKGVIGTKMTTSYIAGPDSAQALFDELNEAAAKGEVPEDVFSKSAQSQEDALDDIGIYQLSKTTDLDQPIPGVHDAFTDAEAGARTLDPGGVIGAGVDAVRVQKNIDTVYGRLGSVVTEAARKYGLDADNLTKRTIVKQIKDTIQQGGKYSAELASGKKITFEEIDAAGTKLAEILVDPRMDTGMLKATLDEFKDVIDDLGKKTKTVGKVGYNAVMKTIKQYLDDYVSMDMQKAAAYLVTSEAGQVSDIAEGARYMEGTEAVSRAQEMILDRLEYLMVEKGLAAYNWGASLNFLNTWKRFSNNPEILLKAGQNANERSEQALKNIVSRAKNSANSLRYMAQERPDFLVPLQMAWEFSDGNIDTLSKLHNFVNQSLGNIEKAFIDLQPEIPNQIVQGFWSNIYNSVLSAFSTPIKAFAGNAILMVQKPISVFAGAAVARDMQTIKRAAYQYMAITDTFGKAFKHMSMVYSKAAIDPSSVSYIMRDDLVAKNEATMDILHSFAMSAQKNGEDGPMVLYTMAETMQDIANHPWLRFGANAMTALDGFTRATLANIEARGRVYDKMIKNSFGPQLSAKDLIKAENEIYDGMFDKSGMITDKAVDYASREIALNLDTDNVKILSNLIARAPFLKPFLMFPRTADNMVGMVNKFSPVSVFIKDYNKLALPGMNFTGQQMKEILDARNIYYSNGDEMLIAFKNLRAEIRGRKAIGTASVMGAVFMFTQDRLTGNGHYDRERQKNRKQLGWKPRSYKGWDGKWYSYDFLGPMSDFIAVTADIMDNSDTIDEPSWTALMNKVGFVLGANLTNKSFLAGLEPMNDVLSGNPAAAARWGASFGSSLLPLSGFRNELGRLMQPELREVDQELMQLFQNRNRFLDVFNPNSGLPTAYDWIDGKPVGYTEGFFNRFWNAYMPMKVADGLSEERQFLVDIEYDARPTFSKSSKGVEYTPEERSELFSLMGKQGRFREAIKRVMKSNEAKAWRAQIKAHRQQGHKIDEQVYANLYYQLDRELRFAKAAAEASLGNYDEIRTTSAQQQINVIDQRRGQAPSFPLQNR